MSTNSKYFGTCMAIALSLCATQIIGNTMLVLVCLAAFVVLLGWACVQNYTLPILLFFLPWSQLLRTSPTTFSFYTVGLVLVCAISIFKNKKRFRRYHIIIGVALLFLSLLSKLMDGSSLSFDYIAFMMMILLFPVVKEEWVAKQYNFYQTVVFFAAGIVAAALCAQMFASSPNIAKYIFVQSYLTITRMAGFYSDPNFYTAQITAALGGGLLLILRQKKARNTVALGVLICLLLYCGLLSASKSFAIVVAVMILLWIIEVLKMRGRRKLKIVFLVCSVLIIVAMAFSSLLGGLIDVFVERFSSAKDISGFTTGRSDLWLKYAKGILEDRKILCLGKGFTKINIFEKSSHSTPLQIMYQFGVPGSILLGIWLAGFYRDRSLRNRSGKNQLVAILLLLTGAFFPWIAIDILFFDEFFLLQWFVFQGVQQLYSAQEESESYG